MPASRTEEGDALLACNDAQGSNGQAMTLLGRYRTEIRDNALGGIGRNVRAIALNPTSVDTKGRAFAALTHLENVVAANQRNDTLIGEALNANEDTRDSLRNVSSFLNCLVSKDVRKLTKQLQIAVVK